MAEEETRPLTVSRGRERGSEGPEQEKLPTKNAKYTKKIKESGPKSSIRFDVRK